MTLPPQHRAAFAGDAEACAAIPFEHLDDVDARGLTCLHLASLAGHDECVRLLLERGASVALETTVVLSPVSRLDRDRAKNLGLPRTTDDLGDCPLLDRGATALHLACSKGHAGIVTRLLEAGADSSALTVGGAAPLHHTARCGSLACLRLLLDRGVVVDAPLSSQAVPGFYDAGMTALHAAAETGTLDVVNGLLDAGADATARTRTGCGTLFFAARSAHADVVRRLVRAGAVVGIPRHAHDDPLREAILHDAEDCIEPLLGAGASVHGALAPEESRHRAPARLLAPPLETAIRLRRTSIAALLRSAGAEAPVYTNLDDAIARGDLDEAKLRLARGERPAPRGDHEPSALELAVIAGSPELVAVLLALGEDPEPPLQRDLQHRDGISLLHRTALGIGNGSHPVELELYRASCLQIAHILLEAGIDPTTEDRHGNPPLHYARRNGFSAMEALLRDAPRPVPRGPQP